MRLWQTILSSGIIMTGVHASAQTPINLDNAHKTHRQAYRHHIKKDYNAALNGYGAAAEAGLAKSELGIARILAFDREGEHEYVAALPWFIRAAAPRKAAQGQGFIEAQRQAQEALDWYCQSGTAEFPQGHDYAKNPDCWYGRGRALFYAKWGVERDKANANLWFEKASLEGHRKARYRLRKTNTPPERYESKFTKKALLFKVIIVLFFANISFVVFRKIIPSLRSKFRA